MSMGTPPLLLKPQMVLGRLLLKPDEEAHTERGVPPPGEFLRMHVYRVCVCVLVRLCVHVIIMHDSTHLLKNTHEHVHACICYLEDACACPMPMGRMHGWACTSEGLTAQRVHVRQRRCGCAQVRFHKHQVTRMRTHRSHVGAIVQVRSCDSLCGGGGRAQRVHGCCSFSAGSTWARVMGLLWAAKPGRRLRCA